MTRVVVGLALFFTYALMVMGNVVTTTGSGLACPDWPLCHGTVNPPHELQVWFEWGHRLLGGTTGALVLLSAVLAFRRGGVIRTLTSGSMGLLVLGVIFGGVIVLVEAPLLEGPLHLAIISFHIVLATIIFAMMMIAFRKLSDTECAKENSFYPTMFGILSLQVFIGILVRYGEAGMACGYTFPLCNGSLFPPVLNFESMIHMTHRAIAIGIFFYALWYAVRAFRTRTDSGRALITIILITAQASLGVGLVQTGMFLPLIILHGAVGFLTLGWLAYRSAPTLLDLGTRDLDGVAA